MIMFSICVLEKTCLFVLSFGLYCIKFDLKIPLFKNDYKKTKKSKIPKKKKYSEEN